MSRLRTLFSLFIACLFVLTGLDSLLVSPDATASTPETSTAKVIRPAQKKTAKKKARGKRAQAKEAMDGEDGAEKTDKPAPSTDAAPADGVLKFSRDIAPIIVANCSGCHNPRQKRGKLDMSTFEKIMEGTPSEKIIAPGKPEESHLILRLKGEETPKMPQGANRNLSEAAIAKIEQWVKAGAVLDAGMDPKKTIASYAASPEDLRKGELAKLTPDERDKQVEKIGRERWKKASPKTDPQINTTAHFIMFSTLPKERAGAVAKALESQTAAVKGILGAPSVEWGEKASLFVFNDLASFGEFVKTNENRESEAGDTGTARLNVPQPYVAVLDPSGGRDEPASANSSAPRKARSKRGSEDDSSGGSGERSLAGLLTENFVIGAASKAGKPPRWVSLGLGALIASHVEKGSAYYKKIRQDAEALAQQGWQAKAQEALGDETTIDHVRAVGFAILEWLASENRALPGEFVKGMLAGGEKLDEVIQNVLNGTREDFLQKSGEYIMTR